LSDQHGGLARQRLRLVHGAGWWTGCLLLCLLAACGKVADAPRPAKMETSRVGSADDAPGDAKSVAVTYQNELANYAVAIEAAQKRIRERPADNLLLLETVTLHIERARLTGDFDDYQQAELLLVASTATAGPLTRTCVPQAQVHYALHRLGAANAALDACPATVATDIVAGLRADIAFHSGRYREAEAIYVQLVNQVGTPQHYIRLALLRNRMGSPGEAAALLEAAEKRFHGRSPAMRAWLKLQRGLVAFERGRIDEAIALYRLASDELPGWWLVDEHLAEARHVSGDTAGAKALYEDLVKRTGRPEHMDALARVLLEGEHPDAARSWIERAGTIYRERLASFPEASASHSAEHFLLFGNPLEALALARRSAQLRPFGESLIALAAAQFQAGLAGEAAASIETVLKSGWNTPQAHAVATTIYEALGRSAEADAARNRALAMNRLAIRMYPLATPVQPVSAS
jgi:tetratricopeptide (TPR) repeat protein